MKLIVFSGIIKISYFTEFFSFSLYTHSTKAKQKQVKDIHYVLL